MIMMHERVERLFFMGSMGLLHMHGFKGRLVHDRFFLERNEGKK